MEGLVFNTQPEKGSSIMAERDWMKGLGVQRWPGQSAQGLKENCQLDRMDSLVSQWEKTVSVWLARIVCWDVVCCGVFCHGLAR